MIKLNKFGQIVGDEWLRTPAVRPNIELDEFVIMPDHMHGIIIINDRKEDISKGELQFAPTKKLSSPSQTLGAIIRGFKGATTKKINLERNTPGVAVWQRNYYEHIIRNERDLTRIRKYIRENPLRLLIENSHASDTLTEHNEQHD